MRALRDRSATTRTVDRALAHLAGALEPETFAGGQTGPGRRSAHRGQAPVEATAGLVDEPTLSAVTSEVDRVTLKVLAERQRIAGALHDNVSQLLFAMSARARRSRDLDADNPAALRATVALLEEQLREAQERLRDVIRDCGPAGATDTVPVATQRDLDDFTDRTGVAAHLLVRGRPAHLPPAVERVALNCLRQALFNIERHAGASVVVVTLDYRPDRLRLVVQDDGRGLPDGFEPRAVPSGGHNWGFTSMAEQVERLGGSVMLRRVDADQHIGPNTPPNSDFDREPAIDQGGTQLRVDLPRPAEAR